MAAKLKGGGVDNIDPAWELLRTQKPWVGVSVMASDAAAPYFENDQVLRRSGVLLVSAMVLLLLTSALGNRQRPQ